MEFDVILGVIIGFLLNRIDSIIKYFINRRKKTRLEIIESNKREVNCLYDTLVLFIKTYSARDLMDGLSYNDEDKTIRYGSRKLGRLEKKSNALKIEFALSKREINDILKNKDKRNALKEFSKNKTYPKIKINKTSKSLIYYKSFYLINDYNTRMIAWYIVYYHYTHYKSIQKNEFKKMLERVNREQLLKHEDRTKNYQDK